MGRYNFNQKTQDGTKFRPSRRRSGLRKTTTTAMSTTPKVKKKWLRICGKDTGILRIRALRLPLTVHWLMVSIGSFHRGVRRDRADECHLQCCKVAAYRFWEQPVNGKTVFRCPITTCLGPTKRFYLLPISLVGSFPAQTSTTRNR